MKAKKVKHDEHVPVMQHRPAHLEVSAEENECSSFTTTLDKDNVVKSESAQDI